MIGEKLGKYTILEIIGHGSMGTVYKAEDPEGQLVALKLVRSHVLYNMEKRERFLQGVLAASEIRHKGICPILEIGDDNDDFFVIMPFIKGKTLDQYMEKKPLPWARALDIARAAGSVLEAIHDAGIAHRALKPANIWILNGREQSILLSDCCIARFTEIAKRGNTHPISLGMDVAETLIPLGALAYMSPEQVRGESVDHRADIFSFGVVLYEMLSGRHPFEARNSLSCINAILETEPVALFAKHIPIPRQLKSILHTALAKNREDRYQSMKKLLQDLNSVRAGASIPCVTAEVPGGIQKWLSSRFRRTLRK
jgi:serine/threonine protein kinase